MDNNETGIEPENKKEKWYKKPCVDVPDGYNPYRDDLSVFTEVYEENKEAFRGPEPLPGEPPEGFFARRKYEWEFAREKARRKLILSANRMSFVPLLYVGMVNYLVMMIEAFIIIAGRSGILSPEGINTSLANNMLEAICYLFIFPSMIIWANVGKKHKVKTFFSKPDMSGLTIVRWAVISIAVTQAVAYATNIVFSILENMGMYVNDMSSQLPDTPAALAFYFICTVICAPVFEEIVFRGVLLSDHLKFGCRHAVIVTAIMFGLLHQNHFQFFFATAVGLIFAVIDIKAGSIIPSIIAHISVNFFSFLSAFFLYFTNYNEIFATEQATSKLDGPTFAMYGYNLVEILSLVIIPVGLIFLAVEWVVNGKKYPMPRGDSGLTDGEKAKAFWLSPVTVICTIVLLCLLIENSFIPENLLAEFVSSFAG